jgi:predicted Zn-dependent protease
MQLPNYQNRPKRGKFKLLPIGLFLIFAIFYYLSNNQINEFTGRSQLVSLSPQQEIALGFQSYKEVLRNEDIISSGESADLVKRVGSNIAKVSGNSTFDWEFNLINSEQSNAFCLPGGKVAVYSGILSVTQNETGLAVVMGHEIAHALARHGAERMAHEQLAQFGQMAVGMATDEMDLRTRQVVLGAFGLGARFGVMLPFSRSHESEADELGLMLMAKACYNPTEAPSFWARMSKAANSAKAPAEFLSTHPSDQTRISDLEKLMPKALEVYNQNCNVS